MDQIAEQRQRIARGLRRAATVGFGLAMVAAPFVALLYHWTAGLAVMAAGLGATAWLLWDGARASALEPQRRRLALIMAAVNAALALACVLVIVIVRPG